MTAAVALCPMKLRNNTRDTMGTHRVCGSPAKTAAGYCLRHDPELERAREMAKLERERPLREAERGLAAAKEELRVYRLRLDNAMRVTHDWELKVTDREAQNYLNDLKGLRSRLLAVDAAEANLKTVSEAHAITNATTEALKERLARIEKFIAKGTASQESRVTRGAIIAELERR